MIVFFVLFLLKFGFTQRSDVIFGIFISFYKFFVFFEKNLSFLIVSDELGQHLSHELIMILQKILLLNLFLGKFTFNLLDFLSGWTLEYTFHMLIIGRDGEFGEWDSSELFAGVGLQGVSLVVIDHSIKIFKIDHRLQIPKADFVIGLRHNKTIIRMTNIIKLFIDQKMIREWSFYFDHVLLQVYLHVFP